MKSIIKIIVILMLLMFPFTLQSNLVKCDKGIISLQENVNAYSDDQKLIIAWNGTHEALILSNDLTLTMQDAFREISGKVLEVIPLPSKPIVTNSSSIVFNRLVNYINNRIHRKSIPYTEFYSVRVNVEFQNIAAPKLLAITKIENIKDFEELLKNYIAKEEIKQTINMELLQQYLDKGYRYFVIDSVFVQQRTTVAPLKYVFKTDKIVFPLKITELGGRGYVRIVAIIVSENRVVEDDLRKAGFRIKVEDTISKDYLSKIDSSLATMFSKGKLWITVIEFSGSTYDLMEDLELRTSANVVRGVVEELAATIPVIAGLIFSAIVPYTGLARRRPIFYYKLGYVVISLALLLILGIISVIPLFNGLIFYLGNIEQPIIEPGIAKLYSALHVGTNIAICIVSIAIAVVLVKRRLLSNKLALALPIAFIAVNVTYVTLASKILWGTTTYPPYTVFLLIIPASGIALLTLIFTGLSWNHIRES